MRASYQPLRASSRRLESPFSWGFLGVLLLALELLLPMCSGDCAEPQPYKTMVPKNYLGGPLGPLIILFYECIPGYGPIDPSKPIKTVCQYDGSYKPALKESCTILSCSKLQEPQNGKVVYVNATTKFGSQVQYVCTEGYYIVGIKNRTCEANETEVIWSGDPPTCEKIFCEPPIHIPNGDYTNRGKDIFGYNETVIYSCKPSNATDHYTLVGESTLVCIGPDEWSSEPPDCKATYTPIDGPTTSAADLDGGLIAVIVLTVLGVAVVGTCV
ncbi:membrane cofactor protein-like isoform X2 [Eptesicus fuscus]|uniref:membrane cofactor protein-like isoform X2 n=1 Tax=Eptesicus fuscus TaxID=29078 RepID=UPI0024044ED7|nr:membrane cofactor protein-like isoform X2 [Eptesicus fuscus]